MNKLLPIYLSHFDVTQKDADRAFLAGVPGLMLCASCEEDHLDPAIAPTIEDGLTMKPTPKGWVCADGYGCAQKK
jgi:hypothetical protein